jgi:hypothetical protein
MRQSNSVDRGSSENLHAFKTQGVTSNMTYDFLGDESFQTIKSLQQKILELQNEVKTLKNIQKNQSKDLIKFSEGDHINLLR